MNSDLIVEPSKKHFGALGTQQRDAGSVVPTANAPVGVARSVQVVTPRHCNFRPQAADVVHHLDHASVIARDYLRQVIVKQSAELLRHNTRQHLH